jgi:hypothetical protein
LIKLLFIKRLGKTQSASCFIACFSFFLFTTTQPFHAQGQKMGSPISFVQGKLVYTPDAQGNRVPDFSYAGYMAGESEIPDAPVRIVVPYKKGDATLRIQSAIDYVSKLPADGHGIKGAVLLGKGVHELSGSLKINASGVVLRGSGMGNNGTTLFANSRSRETVVRIAGMYNRKQQQAVKITDPYVPVNATKFAVADPASFKVGDRIVIQRPSTLKWIAHVGTDHFGGGITALGWKPGTRDILWDRKVVSIEGQTISIDAPLTTALDSTYGGGTISKYEWSGRIEQAGIENLVLRSAYDKSNVKDEEHAWMGVTMENVTDAWARQVVFEHFAGSAVAIFETASRVTVEDCKSLAPVSEIGGERRNSFFTNGQQTLFQRCYAEYGYHDFAVGFTAAGPNAFVQCESHLPYSFSGAIDSWASGILFDIVNVDGNALSFANRWQDGQGAGWAAANSVFWNCASSRMDCFKPPTANNYAFGSWAQFNGDGYWAESNNHIQPRSLYYAQLSDRSKGKPFVKPFLLEINTNASSSPTIEVAQELAAAAKEPAASLTDFVDEASARHPISITATNIKSIDEVELNKIATVKPAPVMQVKNGWLLRGDKIETGKRQDVQWWSGSSRPYALASMKPHVTRFVPGRTGFGLTDDLEEVTNHMQKENIVALEYNYALWYDRRRDDHQRVRRMDGEVWPPFYELPFARSGQGTAWDGLSKYDLTKYNTWYWNRLKQFADLADQKGLVLIYQNYFQHNIIEAGAHYADFPWRTANNINNTGFPEPVPYAGDKRIFMAEAFYDVTHPVRRKLHKAYIRKCLENFASNNGVIHFISAEFTGPLHFVEFWLDTIKEWEKETGKKVLVGLSTTKDVQDAILADKARAAGVDIIDIRYWHHRNDGTVYAPPGGLNLAPRQHARLVSPGRSSFSEVYRAVREYKEKYPEKAVIYSADSYDQLAWAAFMAGGSLTALPIDINESFLMAAATMKPVNKIETGKEQCMLANQQGECIIYNQSSATVTIDLTKMKGVFKLQRIDPATGQVVQQDEEIKAGQVISVNRKGSTPEIIWVSRPVILNTSTR